MKVAFVAYNYLAEYNTPMQWIDRIKPFAGLMEALSKNCEVSYTGLINYVGGFSKNGVEYHFLPSNKRKPRFPFYFHKTIKKIDPDIVVVLGLQYPLQILQLRWGLKKKVKIVARHHADKPPGGMKKRLQSLADHCIDLYLFSTQAHAEEWINTGIIKDKKRILEVFEASSDFYRLNKDESCKKTGMEEGNNFLWVGRLNPNKDPLTVLSGFEKYLSHNPFARLHMIFQEDDLLQEIKSKIQQSSLLKSTVKLHGFVTYDELPLWYSAADFFISGSHREGGSYALLEAMACGCIPIVTAIPASLKSIDKGKYGFSYEAGNADLLANRLLATEKISKSDFSSTVEGHFKKELSSKAIANQLYEIFKKLLDK